MCEKECLETVWLLILPYSPSLLSGSEAKSCLAEKKVVFIGDSRIRQLFYSFITILDPEQREDGNKVIIGK